MVNLRLYKMWGSARCRDIGYYRFTIQPAYPTPDRAWLPQQYISITRDFTVHTTTSSNRSNAHTIL